MNWKTRYSYKKGQQMYKVGDKVKILRDLTKRNPISNYGVNDEMRKLEGKIVTIIKVREDREYEWEYRIDDGLGWSWSSGMFE